MSDIPSEFQDGDTDEQEQKATLASTYTTAALDQQTTVKNVDAIEQAAKELPESFQPVGDDKFTDEEEEFCQYLARNRQVKASYLQAFKMVMPTNPELCKKLVQKIYRVANSKKVVDRVNSIRDARVSRRIVTLSERKAYLSDIVKANIKADALDILSSNALGIKRKKNLGAVASASRSITGEISSIRTHGPAAVVAAIKELNLIDGVYDGSGAQTPFQIALQQTLVQNATGTPLPIAQAAQPAFGVYQPNSLNEPMSSQGGEPSDAV